MAKFTSIEGLSAFNVAGKVYKAAKDGTFELAADVENLIRAAGHKLEAFIEQEKGNGRARATAPEPTAPEPEAQTEPEEDQSGK